MAQVRPDLPCRDGCRRARAGRCSGTLCHSAIRQPNPSPRARKGQDCWSRPVAAVGVAPQCPHGRAARAAGAGHGAGTGVHGGPSTSEGRCRLGCGPCRPAAGCRQVNRFRLTRPLEATCRGACIGHMGRQGRSGTTRCTILGRHLRPRLGRDAATGLFSRAAVPARLEHDRAAAARSRGGFSDAERRLHYQFRTRTTASRRPCSSLRRRPIR